MLKYILYTVLIGLVSLSFLKLKTNNDNPTQIVRNFYDWYLAEGRDKIWPTFKKSDNEFTTLNIQEAKIELIKHNVSEKLINSYVGKFKDCLDSLARIKYEDFSKIDDITDVEEIGCDVQSDFWFADSFELPEDYKITSGEYLKENIFIVKMESESANQKFKVTVIKNNGDWYINKIEFQ